MHGHIRPFTRTNFGDIGPWADVASAWFDFDIAHARQDVDRANQDAQRNRAIAWLVTNGRKQVVMADNPHFVTEGVQDQTPSEKIIYTLTTTATASTPVVSSVKAYDKDDDDADVTTTVLSGSSSVSDDVITLPIVQSLTIGKTYWVHVIYTSGGNTFENIVPIKCKY